jgi:HSP20 family molecular chaperone IbpA
MSRTPELMPSMDVAETDKEIEITAELPGVEEKDVQVNVAETSLPSNASSGSCHRAKAAAFQ